jgi:hypothetical protein
VFFLYGQPEVTVAAPAPQPQVKAGGGGTYDSQQGGRQVAMASALGPRNVFEEIGGGVCSLFRERWEWVGGRSR